MGIGAGLLYHLEPEQETGIRTSMERNPRSNLHSGSRSVPQRSTSQISCLINPPVALFRVLDFGTS